LYRPFSRNNRITSTDEILSSPELLSMLLGTSARRRLEVISMGNDELFTGYRSDLALRTRNARNLRCDLALLDRFRVFLADRPPSAALAKAFIVTYTDRAPGTLLRYATTVKGFMKFCGEPLDDLNLARPKKLPEYIEDDRSEKLLAAIPNKRSHKDTIPRDLLSGLNGQATNDHRFALQLRLLHLEQLDGQVLYKNAGDPH